MTGFLSICTRHKTFGFFNNFLPLSSTPSYPVRYIFWKKVNCTWNISSWCMPQLERFLNIRKFIYLYVQNIESSVSSTFLRYLRLPNAFKGTLFWKKMIFFMKYFKLVHAQTWNIPHYMTGFLSICTRHEAFGFFDCFALSATLLSLERYISLEKDDISWNISSWSMPQLERFLIIWEVFYSYVQGMKHSVSSTSFALSATP